MQRVQALKALQAACAQRDVGVCVSGGGAIGMQQGAPFLDEGGGDHSSESATSGMLMACARARSTTSITAAALLRGKCLPAHRTGVLTSEEWEAEARSRNLYSLTHHQLREALGNSEAQARASIPAPATKAQHQHAFKCACAHGRVLAWVCMCAGPYVRVRLCVLVQRVHLCACLSHLSILSASWPSWGHWPIIVYM